jgi:topoisomerase-4 subunit A
MKNNNEIKLDDVKHVMRDNWIRYASYVVLDRAIPDVVDGLKPVQRRILSTLRNIHDGKLHKVANVAGQTMALHPHGDAAITEALVNMANKGYLLDMQGNFGNIYTGDPAAAPRYIETRLSPLAMATMFNPDLTPMIASYDSRNMEPVTLPAKIPLLLIQGAEGIAVGMATKILPHNFVELLEAEIAILEGRPFEILPDFPTGGLMDASDYNKGLGKVKIRAKVEIRDPKTIAITEVCYGTTTEQLIRSIDEAAKKGKIKIESINDYTAGKVEIEIKLPRGQYAEDLIDALYAYTECEITLNSQIVVIKDDMPWEPTVDDILHFHVEKVKGYLERELELVKERLQQKIFEKTLEQIFIENRLYKKIENVADYDEIHDVIAASLKPYHAQLIRVPTYEDREKLLSIPIRRISRFDINKNEEEIVGLNKDLAAVEKNLKSIVKFTINYLKELIQKFGKHFPRKTEIKEIGAVDLRAIETRMIKVGFDPATGFIGTKVQSDVSFECTNFDKILLMFKDGSYTVTNIPEKQYVHHENNKVVYAGPADKKTVIRVVYKDSKTRQCYAKRFVVTQFILDKEYRYFEEGCELQYVTSLPDVVVEMTYVPKPKSKASGTFSLDSVLVKGVTAKGIRMDIRPVQKLKLVKGS